jgi:hypothetical protein
MDVCKPVRWKLPFVFATAALAISPGAAQARSYTIDTAYVVTKLGPLKTKSSRHYTPTLRKAIRAFGQPANSFRHFGGCVAKWRRLGLRIEFYNLGDDGGRPPCHPTVGRTQSFTIERSTKWRTWKGLPIGMPEEAVFDHHPTAGWIEDHEHYPDGYWLRENYSPIGEAGNYPILAAYLHDGDTAPVDSFYGWIGSAGE